MVCNFTVPVHLSAMGRLDLLREIFGEIYIPIEVYEEVVTRGANRAGMMEVSNASWINVQRITNHLAFEVLSTTLGAGESACIVLAFEIGADLVILDDRAEFQRVMKLWRSERQGKMQSSSDEEQ